MRKLTAKGKPSKRRSTKKRGSKLPAKARRPDSKRRDSSPKQTSHAEQTRLNAANAKSGQARGRQKPPGNQPNPTLSALSALLADKSRLTALLQADKDRRGIPHRSLRFVGAHNIAQLTWCPMFAVLKSRDNELSTFFRVYLDDRVRMSVALGRITQPPTTDDAWLDIGNDIELSEVEAVARQRYERQAPERARQRRAFEYEQAVLAQLIKKYPGGRDEIEETGESLEEKWAERYPKTRWHFEWFGFAITAQPDGLTDEFVYEFKTHKMRRFLGEDRRNAYIQADIYGVLFKRAQKRVQILTREDNLIETTMTPVDDTNAQRVLTQFRTTVDADLAPAQPPWKCRQCEFNTSCPILQRR